jgi:hypothetical protein
VQTTTGILSNLKFYPLPFSKRIEAHPFKLVEIEEEFFSPFCPN